MHRLRDISSVDEHARVPGGRLLPIWLDDTAAIEIVTWNTGEASDLRIVASSKVFELERVRIVEGAALSLDRSILVPAIAATVAGIDFSARSLFQTVRELNAIEPSRGECLLRAITTDRRTADLLGLTEGDPLLELTETVFDQYGDPFEYGRHLNRGDRYAFRTTVVAGGVWDGPTG